LFRFLGVPNKRDGREGGRKAAKNKRGEIETTTPVVRSEKTGKGMYAWGGTNELLVFAGSRKKIRKNHQKQRPLLRMSFAEEGRSQENGHGMRNERPPCRGMSV